MSAVEGGKYTCHTFVGLLRDRGSCKLYQIGKCSFSDASSPLVLLFKSLAGFGY
jgi:hypothetical protein